MLQDMRNFPDGFHIRGDVFAFVAVAAGRRLHEVAVLITQRAGEPVDLGLRRYRQRRVGRKAEETAHPRDEILDLEIGKDVAEREHRDFVPDFGELLQGRRADALAERFFADKLGMRLFKRFVAAAQIIIVRVRDDRRILAVIELVMTRDFTAEAGVFRARRSQIADCHLWLFHSGNLARNFAREKPVAPCLHAAIHPAVTDQYFAATGVGGPKRSK